MCNDETKIRINFTWKIELNLWAQLYLPNMHVLIKGFELKVDYIG